MFSGSSCGELHARFCGKGANGSPSPGGEGRGEGDRFSQTYFHFIECVSLCPSGRSNRATKETAIHSNIRAGDKTARPGTGEKNRGADQLVRFTEPFHRCVPHDCLGSCSRCAVRIE